MSAVVTCTPAEREFILAKFATARTNSVPMPTEDPLQRVTSRVVNPKQQRDGSYLAPCPAHNDHNPSLTISRGDDGRVLICCRSGCTNDAVVAAMGLKMADLFPPRRSAPSTAPRPAPRSYETREAAIEQAARLTEGQFERSWAYLRADGNVCGEILRFKVPPPKRKTYRPITPVGDGWKVGDPDGLWPLLNLPALLSSTGDVYVCEGEPATDAAVSLGLSATTSAHGAQSPHKTDWTPLAGRTVVILPDRDAAGEKFASTVTGILSVMGCPVKIVRLPNLPEGGDCVEYLEAGGTAAQIQQLVDAAPAETTSITVAPATEHDVAKLCTAYAFPLTDSGNGERLIDRHGDDLRWVSLWKRWACFSVTHWKVDDDGEIDRLALETMRDLKRQGLELSNHENPDDKDNGLKLIKHAHSTEAAKKIKDMIDRAGKVKGVSISPETLDADPYLLGVLNGTLDLKTGKLRPHRREDLITKICPIHYDPTLTATVFLAFLDKIFQHNGPLIAFIRRMIGYALTGITSERSLFMLYGKGANGKSTLLAVLRELLGPYATAVPASTLTAKHGDGGIPNDIARLKGARIVSAIETDEGRRMAEALVKQMTGGEDMLTGRFMRAEFFDFKPTFKLFIATNHRPEIRGTDPAIWDRIKLIPFDVRFYDTAEEAEEQCGDASRVKDKQLADRLRDELGGILAWAVQDCLEWQRDGLGVPAEVREATETYQDEMDKLRDFIDECCIVAANAKSGATLLYDTYKVWCSLNGETAITQTKFGRTLEERGFKSSKSDGRKYRSGIGIKASDRDS